jgi:hypothetical protein
MFQKVACFFQRIARFVSKPFLKTWEKIVLIGHTISTVAVNIYDFSKNLALTIGGEFIFVALIISMLWIKKEFVTSLSLLDQSLLQNFIEWYAIIYTIILSIIVGHAWRKYVQINNEIDREADALVLLVQTSRMFKNQKLSKALFYAVKRYVLCQVLWQSRDCRTNGETREKVKEIRQFVVKLMRSESDDTLKTDLLNHYNEAYDARGDRFDLTEQKLPNHSWLIFVLASLVWLWGFLWLEFESGDFKIYILGSTIFTLSYLFYAARDLNDPTKGNWKMKFDSFRNHIF